MSLAAEGAPTPQSPEAKDPSAVAKWPKSFAVRYKVEVERRFMPQFLKPSPERSAVMRAVKSRDTKPEIAVRAMLRSFAPGYRLCRADLPGKPDIVYGHRKLAIFVHGCFWHGHDCPRGARMPQTNAEYWRAKIARNRARDLAASAALTSMGWRALTVYECELKDPTALRARLGAEFA